MWGVVYEVDGLAWQQIDARQRRAGYREERVAVVGPDRDEQDASVYVARTEMIDDSIPLGRIETRSSPRQGKRASR